MLTREIQIDASSLLDRAGEPKKGEKDHLMNRLCGQAIRSATSVIPESDDDDQDVWVREYDAVKKRFVYKTVNS